MKRIVVEKERFIFMGSNSTKAWIEAALFAVLAIALAYVAMPFGEYTIVFALLPLFSFLSAEEYCLTGFWNTDRPRFVCAQRRGSGCCCRYPEPSRTVRFRGHRRFFREIHATHIEQ